MSTTYETDSKLIQAITRMKEGDESGFAYLYEATYKYVSARAKAMLDDEQERQDLIQEVYLSIYRSIKNLEEPDKIYGWIKTLIFNQYTKLIKKGRKEVLVSEEAEDVLEEIPDYESQTEDDYVNKEDIEIIRSCIERLPEEQRTVVMAYYFDNLKVNEISDLFSVSDGTVKSRLFAARKKLKQNIEEEEKKLGYKLHSFGGFTLILAIRAYLQQNMEATHMAKESLITQIYQGLKETVQSTEKIVKTVADNTANTTNMMTKATGLGGKKLLWTIVGVVSAAVVGMSAIAMVSSNKPEEAKGVTEAEVADVIARNTAYREELALFNEELSSYYDDGFAGFAFNVKDYDGNGNIELSITASRPDITRMIYIWKNGKCECLYGEKAGFSVFYNSEMDASMHMMWVCQDMEDAYPGMNFVWLKVYRFYMDGNEENKKLYEFKKELDGTYIEIIYNEDTEVWEKVHRTKEEIRAVIEENIPNYVLIENTIPYSPENLDKYLPIDEDVVRKQLEEAL